MILDVSTEKKEKVLNDSEINNERVLILFNDTHNSFEFVIESLIDVCEHTMEQATQCTFIAHFKGSCEIKKGTYELLKQMFNKLTDKGLTVVID